MTIKLEKTQEELFETDCKVLNLNYEYNDYDDAEKWAIITDLSEKELREKYPDIIEKFIPFVLLSVEQGEIIEEYKRSEEKYKKRTRRNNDMFGYDDEFSPQFHNELCIYDELSFEREDKFAEEEHKNRQIEMVKRGMELLSETQKRRVKAIFFENKTLREVADKEGVNFTKIDKSIKQVLKKIKKILETGGTKPDLCPNE